MCVSMKQIIIKTGLNKMKIKAKWVKLVSYIKAGSRKILICLVRQFVKEQSIATIVKEIETAFDDLCVKEANNYGNWTKQMGGNK